MEANFFSKLYSFIDMNTKKADVSYWTLICYLLQNFFSIFTAENEIKKGKCPWHNFSM